MKNSRLEQLLERSANALEELLIWTRATSFPLVQEIINGEFAGEDEAARTRALVYALTDGARSTREITETIGGTLKHVAIAALQQKWRRMGLAAAVNPDSKRPKTKALFDLSDFDIEVNMSAGNASTKSKKQPQTATSNNDESEAHNEG